jgi:hypothetical protein
MGGRQSSRNAPRCPFDWYLDGTSWVAFLLATSFGLLINTWSSPSSTTSLTFPLCPEWLSLRHPSITNKWSLSSSCGVHIVAIRAPTRADRCLAPCADQGRPGLFRPPQANLMRALPIQMTLDFLSPGWGFYCSGGGGILFKGRD